MEAGIFLRIYGGGSVLTIEENLAVEWKGRKRSAAEAVELEFHVKTEQLGFPATSRGEVFAAAGSGIWFRERCDEADFRTVPAHGLRKAAAVHHALHGATASGLMAWFGWKTIGEAHRCIEEANRTRLAESAAEKVMSRTGAGKLETQFAKKRS